MSKFKSIDEELMYCAGSDKEKLIKTFKESSVSIKNGIIQEHKADAIGMTLIHWAAHKKDLDLVKYLVDQGVDHNIKDGLDWNTLKWAQDVGDNQEVVTYLLGLDQ